MIAGAVVLSMFVAAQTASTWIGNLQGIVVDSRSGRGIPGVAVSIVDARIGAITDDRGRFLLLNVPGKRHMLRFQHVGYGEQLAQIDLPGEGGADLTVRLDPKAFALKGIDVTVSARSRWLVENGFYERRDKSGASGRYFVRDDLLRRPNRVITDFLDDVAGVTAGRGDIGQTTVRFSRLTGACEPDFYVDGSLHRASSGIMTTSGRLSWSQSPNKVDNYNVVPAHQVEGIEVYVGAATPVQFSNASGCGVILLWLRR